MGIDIIDSRRIKKIILKYGDKFKKRCFLTNEIERSEKKINSINSYAKRYAAKEALTKALGTGIRKGINFKDIEISNNSYGKPSIKLKGTTVKFLKKKIKKKKYIIHLSLSDDLPWAQATVIISYK